MVNPERSWSEVIIEYLERGGEIVANPLRSHTLKITQSAVFFLQISIRLQMCH